MNPKFSFKDILRAFKGGPKAILNDFQKGWENTNVKLTDRANRALEFYPETMRSVNKTGPSGITMDNASDLTKFKERGFDNWRDYQRALSKKGNVMGVSMVVEKKIKKIAQEATSGEITKQEAVVEMNKAIAGSRMRTDKKDVYMWTPAPVAPDVPRDIVEAFRGRSAVKGGFKSPVTGKTIKEMWNEINQQAPKESYNNKKAFLETMLAVGHAESNNGMLNGGLDRNSNIWNVGFNARKDSVLKYDPQNQQEAIDRAVRSFINDFGVFKNKGMTDQNIHNYHIGPGLKFDKAGARNYRASMGGLGSYYTPKFQWDK